MSINFSNFRKSKLFILYILSFIFAFTASIPAYINSSFIQSLTTQQAVGLIFALNAVFSLVALIYIPKLLKKFGNYKITLYLSILYFINFLGLAFFHSTFLVLFCFLISGALSTAIYFNFDIFIEHNSPDMVTGGIRGTYLTSLNLAWLFSPWLAGIIVEQFSFRMIYLIVALIMIPILFIITSSLKDFKDPDYTTFNMFETIKSISSNKNIKNIITSGFMLQFFYSWMVIYGTIYLNHYVGFDFVTSGIIFSIALIPFVVVQIPLGYLADKKLGEKELLTLGYILMGVSTAIIPLVHNRSILIWTIILFVGRTGAAIVEVMNDTYFFKQVNDKNLSIINFYRLVGSFAYVVAPLIAVILMMFMPIYGIFYILGLLMIFAIRYTLTIKDTL